MGVSHPLEGTLGNSSPPSIRPRRDLRNLSPLPTSHYSWPIFTCLYFIQYRPNSLLLAGFFIAKVWERFSFLKQLQGRHHRRKGKTKPLLYSSWPLQPHPARLGSACCMCCPHGLHALAAIGNQLPHSDASSESFSTQCSKDLLRSVGTGM